MHAILRVLFFSIHIILIAGVYVITLWNCWVYHLIVLLKTMHIVHSPFLKQSRRPLIAIIKLIIKCVKDKLLWIWQRKNDDLCILDYVAYMHRTLEDLLYWSQKVYLRGSIWRNLRWKWLGWAVVCLFLMKQLWHQAFDSLINILRFIGKVLQGQPHVLQ